jgi:hypothetical protein
MSYRVDKFNGKFLVSVADGTIDTTTDLRFIGRNYAGYGEVQNENFLHLLESFANITPPPKVITGQIWYDTANRKLKFYDGSQFKIASGAVAQSSQPAGLTSGDLWFDTSTEQLYTYNGSDFVLIGPENTPELLATSVTPATVRSTPGNQLQTVLLVNVNDETVAVISRNSFDLSTQETRIITADFPRIRAGFTLKGSNVNGESTSTVYWGTASNALRFGGRPISDFALNSGLGSFNDNGLTVGDQNDLRIFVENGDSPVIENQLGGTSPSASITLRIRTGGGIGDVANIAVINSNSMFPGTNNSYNLGTIGARWNTVFAESFNGNLKAFDSSFAYNASTKVFTGIFKGNLRDNLDVLKFDANTGTFFGIFGTSTTPGTFTGVFNGILNGTATTALNIAGITTSESAVANTIPIRDANGNLIANRFTGIADRADQLIVSGNYRSTSLTATGNTIPARDSLGDIFARKFQGTATAAEYADLAEKYLTDRNYDVGTVISVGGEKEVRESMIGDRALGVISENPAFMMNKDLEGGQYVALKGRVPVKVKGPVRRGDRLVADNNGVAVAAELHQYTEVFAISLENSDINDMKLIESVII